MASPVILCLELQLAENLGAIARVMKNFGLDSLRLIRPHCSPLAPQALATSAGADDLLAQAQIYESVSLATQDLTYLFGTCAVEREGIKRYGPPREIFQNFQPDGSWGILFGPERTGLSNQDIAQCHGVLQIPTDSAFSSLNIAQSVAICAYEFFQLSQTISTRLLKGKTNHATLGEIQRFLDMLEQSLDHANYWRVPDKKPLMWQMIQNIVMRTDLTQQEIKTLFGMIDRLKTFPNRH